MRLTLATDAQTVRHIVVQVDVQTVAMNEMKVIHDAAGTDQPLRKAMRYPSDNGPGATMALAP